MADILEQARELSRRNGAVRDLWKAYGGRQHGPHVEHFVIPETRFWEFIDAVFALAEPKWQSRVAALEAQLAEAVAHEREECAKIAERDVDWASFGMRQAAGSNPEIFESDPDERNVTIYRAGICSGRSIAAAIRGRNKQ